jgi:glycerate 2-kinase
MSPDRGRSRSERFALRVVVAPDSFKGSITASDAARALARGWLRRRPADDVTLLPLADGGEGTIDAFSFALTESVRMSTQVRGPDDRPVLAEWLLLPDGTAVVELAQSSGLPLMAALDPLGAHTIGLGETIATALDRGCARLVVALGGSASTDGGTGALSALGARFLDGRGVELAPGGGCLVDLDRVELGQLRPRPPCGVSLLTDVTTPLYGPTGAAATFGPQKGAIPHDVARLDRGLRRLAEVVGGKPDEPGAGAAGGIGYGLAAMWGATIEPGAGAIAALVGLRRHIDEADVVITGEGRFDVTSLAGKVVGNVIAEAGGRTKLCVVAGAVTIARPAGVDTTASLSELAGSVTEAIKHPETWLTEAGARLADQVASPTGEAPSAQASDATPGTA